MEREDLLKRLEEMQEPQLKYLAMLNEAFLQSMDIIHQIRALAWDIREEYCNDEIGNDIACVIANKINIILDGEQEQSNGNSYISHIESEQG